MKRKFVLLGWLIVPRLMTRLVVQQAKLSAYKELSQMLSMKIENENQYQLALAGAPKEIVEKNLMSAGFYAVYKAQLACDKSYAEWRAHNK